MKLWKLEMNAGMVAATVILAVGAVIVLGPGRDDDALHWTGVRIVMLAGAVYLVSRIVMFLKQVRG